jgi:hypothetical protein
MVEEKLNVAECGCPSSRPKVRILVMIYSSAAVSCYSDFFPHVEKTIVQSNLQHLCRSVQIQPREPTCLSFTFIKLADLLQMPLQPALLQSHRAYSTTRSCSQSTCQTEGLSQFCRARSVVARHGRGKSTNFVQMRLVFLKKQRVRSKSGESESCHPDLWKLGRVQMRGSSRGLSLKSCSRMSSL